MYGRTCMLSRALGQVRTRSSRHMPTATKNKCSLTRHTHVHSRVMQGRPRARAACQSPVRYTCDKAVECTHHCMHACITYVDLPVQGRTYEV